MLFSRKFPFASSCFAFDFKFSAWFVPKQDALFYTHLFRFILSFISYSHVYSHFLFWNPLFFSPNPAYAIVELNCRFCTYAYFHYDLLDFYWIEMEQDDCFQSVTETKYDCLLFGEFLLLPFTFCNLWEIGWNNFVCWGFIFDFQMWMIPFIPWVLVYQRNALRTSEVNSMPKCVKSLCIFLFSKFVNWVLFIYHFCLEYMISKLGVEEEKVPEMCAELYKDYGTTMAGLRVWFPSIMV